MHKYTEDPRVFSTGIPEMETNTSSGWECLVFHVNGERFEVPEIDPSTTLLEFLRSSTRFKSVKLSCGQGGCGACVVLLSKYDPVLKQVENYSINSCLTLICSLNRCSVTTSEGLGNSKEGFHPIHERFAEFHASQCGFCTPGFCMSLYSALVNAENDDRPEALPGFSKLTVSEAEKSVTGNLCRCTGYRPIADVCKSFASDVDLEDLGTFSFRKKGGTKEVRAKRLPSYNPKNHACPMPLEEEYKSMKVLNSKKLSWYSPVNIAELQQLLASADENGLRIKLVVGNTGDGYYEETETYDMYIDLRFIPELSTIKKDKFGVEFGATLSISKVIEYLKENSKLSSGYDGGLVFAKIADHMEKVASIFIRNSGSLGGNLVMTQRKYFPSDISALLLAAGSSVSIFTCNEHEKITFEDFLNRPPMDSKSVLLSVHIPLHEPTRISGSRKTNSKLLFESYRAAPRPLGNALPYLTAAFLADISCDKDGVLVNSVRLVFGSFGTKHPIRARKVEEYLAGKWLSLAVVNEAVRLVKIDVVPEDGTSHAAYRSSLAVGYVFTFLSSFTSVGSSEDLIKAMLGDTKISSSVDLGRKDGMPLISSAKQVTEPGGEYYPVGEPIIKAGAAIQASGEAVFVDDIPSPPNCLHGAFIYSTRPVARVKSISVDSDSLPSAVKCVITVDDIPKEGENIGSITMFGSEPLFPPDFARCAGDRIAFVIADSQKRANVAAKTALVDYDIEGLDPPILTVEEAVERSSFFEIPASLKPEEVGDFSQGMEEADHKIISAKIKLGSQYYFYMETQAALAIPDEENCMLVYSSIQNPEYAHTVIARCLGIPEHNVRVITRRVGGGFGGKAMKGIPVATTCALAAHKLNRPVRIYQDRKTDMIMAGGRHPVKLTYSIGFKSDGKVTALHVDILIDAGITEDASPLMPNNIIAALKKYNWGSLSFDVKVCKTNKISRSIMRGPCEVQGSFIAEAILEHVASVLSMDPDSVRNRNLHSYESLKLFYGSSAEEAIEYSLPSIWDKVARSSSFAERSVVIDRFNDGNKWCKRGISRVPVVHELMVRPTPGKVSILWDGSVVVEVGGIEVGQGLHTKVKQATAYALGLIQCDGIENLVEKVRVVQADTLSVVQGGLTAGSTTSEASCEAVRLCCNVLVKRLAPLKKNLEEQMGSVTWEALILQAHQNINLAANSYFVPEVSSIKYLNYGAAVSEVEVNILTGETRILRTDIIYDCGQSLNPAVDMGQIEGAFVQGIGFFMLEEYRTNEDGLVTANGIWNYEIPTMDNIPKEFNAEVLNTGKHPQRILSSKASGEPPLLLAASVHCAIRAAIKAARKQLKAWGAVQGTEPTFEVDVPAIMPVVKQLCGLDTVEIYLQYCLMSSHS